MASIGNYASALAEAAKKTITESISGIGAAIKGAARSEMPGFNSAYSFAEAVRSGANSRSNKNDKDKKSTSSSSSAASTNQSSGGTNFNASVATEALVVRELQLINANIIEQTRLLRYQVDSAKTKSQYDEENAREQALRDSKLLDAINNIGSRGGAGGAGGGGGEGSPGIGSALASGAAGGIMSRIFGGGGGSKGSFGKKLLKGGGVLGLGAGALYTYGRMKNGENISDIAKDLAPGLTGAALGGFVGSIAGPLGTILGSMIGGALGDSNIGRKMFDDILPKIKELGAAVGIDFDQIKTSFETVLLPKIKSSVENLTKVFNDVIIPNLRIVSQQLNDSFESIQGTFNTKIIPGLNKLSESSGKVLDRILSVGVNEAGKLFKSTNDQDYNNPKPPSKPTNGPGPEEKKVLDAIAAKAYTEGTNTEILLRNARIKDRAKAEADRLQSERNRNRREVEAAHSENRRQAEAAGGRVISNFTSATPVTPAGGTSFERTSDASGLGFSYDPKELLDLIAKAESGRMGYTAANKGKPGDMPQGYPQLKDLTISQVMDMQQSRPGKQREFFAVGRYQIIPETLKGLMRGDYGPTGLNVDDKFSEENQDKLALVLIKNREKRAKKAGGGLDTFQKEISQEWAGIGLPNTNLSSYEDINGNKASVNTDAFRKIFKQNTTPTESKIKYPWDSTDRAKLESVVGSGTTLVDNTGAKLVEGIESVRKEVREAANATINAAEKIGKDTLNNLKDLSKSGARTANAVAPRRRKRINPLEKTPEQIIAETNASFAKAFQRAVPKAFNLALRQALFPKGVGVSQQAASGSLFRGQQLNNILGVGKGANKLATSLFGKQYGPMFAPALNDLATGYLEAGARAGGRVLFGMIGGMNAEKSNILTGQILGNYASGNKKLAMEQLIYGTTGVATGYETVFAKYGFKNPMEGVNYMANTLGAAVSDPVARFMDPKAKASEWIDPRTGKKVGLNSTSSFTTDSYGRYNVPPSESATNATIGPTWTRGYDREPTVKSIVGGDEALVIRDEQLNEIAKKQALLQEEGNAQRVEAEIRRQTDAAEAKYANQQGDQGIIGEIRNLTTVVSQGRVGSGSTAGGSLGGGGGNGLFFQGGGPLAAVGNMSLDLGRVAATNAIYKGLGGKGTNPYTAALANFAINQGIQYGAKLAWSYAAPYAAPITNAITGYAQTGGAYVMNSLGMTGYSATNVAAPIVDKSITAASGSIASAAGATEATWVAAETGEMLILSSEAAGGGTAAAGGSGFLSSAWQAAMSDPSGTIATIAVILAAVYVIGELFGVWDDDDEPYQPNIIMERVLLTRGNNDINAISPLWTHDLGYLKEEGQIVWMAICDQLLRIGFNASKAMEVKAKQVTNMKELSPTDLPFYYMVACVQTFRENSDVVIAFFKDDPKPRQNAFAAGFGNNGEVGFINFGKLVDFTKLDANNVSRRIVKKVEDLWKKSYTSKNIGEDLTKTAEALQKVSYQKLGSGLLDATSSKLDMSLSDAVYGDMQPKTESGRGFRGGERAIVYNQQTGQWVEDKTEYGRFVPTGNTTVVWKEGGGDNGYVLTYEDEMVWVEGDEYRLLGYDKMGRPIYDFNKDGKLSKEDFFTDANDPVYKELLSKYNASAALAGTGPFSGSVTAIVASLGNLLVNESGNAKNIEKAPEVNTSVVNSGNATTNNNSSTTIIKRTDSLDVLRSASTQTAIPIG